MATIKIEIVAGANTYTATKTLAAASATRLLNAYKALYGQVPSGPADPVTGVVPMRDRTDAEVADALFTGLFNGVVANVKSQESGAAAKVASDAVVPIALT